MTKAAITTSTKTTKTTKKVVKSSPVVEPEVVEQQVVEQPVQQETPVVQETADVSAEVPVETIRSRVERLIKSKQDLISDLKREIVELKRLQRDHELAVKDASKKGKKKRVQRDDATPRKPSGFASPVVVSDQLYSFLSKFGVNKGDPVARTDVTRYITTYIREQNLQNPEHRREIVPDADLKEIFGEPMEHKDPNDTTSPKVFTYLKLQKYLSPHFPKALVKVEQSV